MRIEPIEPRDGVPGKDREEHQATHVLLLIFLLLAAGIITAGYSYYRHFAKHYRTEVEHQLNAVAELKVGYLTQWRNERVGDAEIFRKNTAFSALVRRTFENPQDLKAQGQLRTWLGSVQKHYHYDRIFLLDTRGLARISVPDDPEPVASILTQRAAETLRSGQITMVDFYRNEYDQRIHLAVLVPVLGGSDGSGAIGVLALRTNPERYLYPFLNRWPTPSRTAETLLIRRDGNNALFLNELKFRTNTALNLRVPLENGELPAVKAALGQEGIVEGTDYRGIPVVADVRAVPGSPWFLVARVDTAEVYAPVRERLWGMIVGIGILLIGAGAGVAFVWRGQSTRFYRERAEASETLQHINEKLDITLMRYRSLFDGVPVGLYRTTPQGLILDANMAFVNMLGYPDRSSLLAVNINDTYVEPADRRRWQDMFEREKIVRDFKTRMLGYDGSIVRVLEYAHAVFGADGRIQYYEGSLLDITEGEIADKELRESEEHFRLIAETIDEAFWMADVEIGKMFYISPAYERVWGRSRESLYEKPRSFIEAVHAEDRERVVADLEIQKTGQPFGHEYRIVRPDGPTRWIWDRGFPVRDETGQVTRYVGVAQDITERKRAEEAMRESEARYRVLFEASADGILIADLEKRGFKYANPALCRMLGYSEEEMRTLSVADIHPKDALQSVVAEFEAQARGDKSLAPNIPCLRKDGSIVYADINATMVAVNGIACNVGFFRDITERKRAEDALRESEAVLRSYFDHGGAMRGIIELMDDDILHISDNAGSAAFFRWTKEAMQNKLETQMGVPRDSLQMWVAHYKKSQRTGAPVTFDYVHNSPEGQKFLSATVTFLEIAQSGRPRFAYLVNDITEQKRLEAEFRQAQKMEAVGILTGGLAHDFNNLLTVINGYSNLLLRDLAQDDPRRSDLEEISLSGQRAASLTSQLLAFSRKQVVQPRILDLNYVVSDMGRMLRRLLRANIDIVALTQPGLGRVKADFGQIQQIIMNLAVNAQDAMPQGGKLTIETANVDLDEDDVRRHPEVPAGPYIMLAVSDNGIGMDAKIQARIFEAFFTTKKPGKGTGLGLSTVRVIVNQSGGFIRVNSEPGKGTTFKIYLPGMEGEANKLAGPAKEKLSLKGVETVLVVEDEPLVLTLTARILREQGYTVLEASNGAAALHTDQEFAGEIHLVITDVVMPGMSARAFVSQIEAARPGIKVLYVSGYTDDVIVHHGVLNPDVAFLQKPFTADDLAYKVREVLDSPTLGAIE
jgi:PAS domain S-box-containing protein